MNLIDFFLFIIILLAVYGGYVRGFIVGSIELISWVAGLLLAFWGYQYIAALIEKGFPNIGVWNYPISFFIALIIARIILGKITARFFATTPPQAHANIANKALGTVPGFVNGIIYATIISALLLAFPLSDGLSEKTRESKIAGRLALGVEWLDEKLSPVFDEAVGKTINNLTVEPESTKSYDLKFTVDNPKPRPDLEAQMLEMVNEERAKEGLKPLKADPEMTEVARAHSRDMFAKGYFAHVNKENETPAQRARKAGVRFLTAGENLALGPTLRICHQGLMNSPGHRANILHKAYGRLGIGVLDGGRHGLMITQNFRN
ncbi:CvpA family protein [Aridibaculum aurantiacum]|uniref:CvpA family protein n=1 Tax=Aridibaculum aurantiacum TaxID=2810307 RepID=UPI001A95D822|nr:CvpA family protein [Aridibaculum aurantiacum]